MGTQTPVEEAWDPWEHEVSSWETALSEIEGLVGLLGDRTTVWRGVVDASWPMHSSLSRKIRLLTGKDPDEAEIQKYELEILRRSRSNWRYDNLPALELMAHLQHFGGPTRLIDVSLNPLVALWFAVEQKYDASGQARAATDGRLFAFTVRNRINLSISEGIDWGGRGLPWGDRKPRDGWGRAEEPPVLWIPPAYNERIAAQNAGFLIGGTPASWESGNKWRTGPGETAMLSIATVRAASSLYIRPGSLDRAIQEKQYPAFTMRVRAEAKEEIRSRLEHRFGYTSSTIYPDLFALAAEVLKTRI